MSKQQIHEHHAAERHRHEDETALADLLDLDAQVAASCLAEIVGWVTAWAPGTPGTVVDLGAGTGTGSLALARRFGTAEVVAIDKSAVMLQRLRRAARGQGVDRRVRTVQADLDAGWPEVG